jgi:hypothetical protein
MCGTCRNKKLPAASLIIPVTRAICPARREQVASLRIVAREGPTCRAVAPGSICPKRWGGGKWISAFAIGKQSSAGPRAASAAGVFAASHAPLIVLGTEVMPGEANDRLNLAFIEIGKQISAARPDVIIAIAPDHWVNFYLDNFPTITLGVGDELDGPPEPLMASFPHKSFAGDPAFGRFILETALSRNFEPSISYRLKLDHGICVPLWLLDLPRMPGIVPVLLNTVEPPFMSCRRFLQWGALLADAVRAYPEDLRVVILATGGLSHSSGIL